MTSEKPSWIFSKRRPSAGRARNSQVEKFFRSDAVEDHSNAIIREGIQNSLDAGVAVGNEDSKTVNVIISIGQVKFEEVKEFFPGLFEHLNSVREKLIDPPDPAGEVRYLVFEDFNTTGLRGDQHEWEPEDNKNAFFNFFRGEGVTEKEGNQRGRHGVGKLVFSSASRAKSVFGLTVSEDNPVPALMGTSTLILHKYNNQSYDPDGWFGVQTTVDNDHLVIPVNDEETVARFQTAFSLDRDRLYGLSIVVPFVHESVTVETTVQSVIRGFMWAILQNRLTIEIRHSGSVSALIAAGQLASLIETTTANPNSEGIELRRNYELAVWSKNAVEKPMLEIELTDGNAPPELKAENIPEELKEKLKTELQNDRPVSCRVLLGIRKRKGESAKESWFYVFLKPDLSCADGCVQFVREGLLIPGVKFRRIPGYRALVIINEGPLASFLGDAENPSHTEWQSQNVKDKFFYADPTIKSVVHFVPNLLRVLNNEKRVVDSTAFLDIFRLPATKKTELPKKPTKKKTSTGSESGGVSIAPLERKPKSYSISKVANGFTIKGTSGEAKTPNQMKIRMAYTTRSGSPFKKYQKEDFRLNSRDIKVELSGAKKLSCEDNLLWVQIDSPEFRIAVSGFDSNRDLYVDEKVTYETEASDATEL